MNPELIQGIKGNYGDCPQGGKAQKSQWNIKEIWKEALKPGLTQRYWKIVFLALMMHYMCCPNGIDFMTQAMKPVLTEINTQKKQNPTVPCLRNGKQSKMLITIYICKKQYWLKNKGLPIFNTNNKGNLFIEFNITYPNLNKEKDISELRKTLDKYFLY